MNYKTVKSLKSTFDRTSGIFIYSLSKNNIDTIFIKSSIVLKELSQVYNIQNYI